MDAPRKLHPRITISSSPEQGEVDDDDQARREIDASMNFKRQEALRHKKKDSRVRPASEHPSHHRRPDLVQQHVKRSRSPGGREGHSSSLTVSSHKLGERSVSRKDPDRHSHSVGEIKHGSLPDRPKLVSTVVIPSVHEKPRNRESPSPQPPRTHKLDEETSRSVAGSHLLPSAVGLGVKRPDGKKTKPLQRSSPPVEVSELSAKKRPFESPPPKHHKSVKREEEPSSPFLSHKTVKREEKPSSPLLSHRSVKREEKPSSPFVSHGSDKREESDKKRPHKEGPSAPPIAPRKSLKREERNSSQPDSKNTKNDSDRRSAHLEDKSKLERWSSHSDLLLKRGEPTQNRRDGSPVRLSESRQREYRKAAGTMKEAEHKRENDVNRVTHGERKSAETSASLSKRDSSSHGAQSSQKKKQVEERSHSRKESSVTVKPEEPSKGVKEDSPVSISDDDSTSSIVSSEPKSERPMLSEPSRSPVYGPARSRFESASDTFGLEEIPPDSPVEIVSAPKQLEESGLPPYFPGIHGCRFVDEFECINRIEEGTYGVVYRARDKRTNEVVALKRLKMEKEKEGFPITSLREVSTLLKAHHKNVVAIREVVVGHNLDRIYMVMEFVEHDLKALMERMPNPFLIGEVKTLMKQLLSAVHYLHDNWIIHRDLKTSNLLLSHKGILKVGDFGLAREYGSPLRPYTPVVVTLWYRAPELLLGVKEYSTMIDIWSVGCIFAEFLTLKPLFPGKSEIEQLNKIFKDLGNPSEVDWPEYPELPVVKSTNFMIYPTNTLRKRFPLTMLTNSGYDLLTKLLEYNPAKRVSAEEALKHVHFTDHPEPVPSSMFPTWPAKSEQGRRGGRLDTPKPPSGGKQFKETVDSDGLDGFRIGQPKEGGRRKGMGFQLKF